MLYSKNRSFRKVWMLVVFRREVQEYREERSGILHLIALEEHIRNHRTLKNRGLETYRLIYFFTSLEFTYLHILQYLPGRPRWPGPAST